MSANYRFENFELDIARAELRHQKERVALEPRAFDVLAHLVMHRERTVTVQELLDQVWGGAAVERGSVHRAVRLIRRTFEQVDPRLELIQTIPRRGYRFLPNAQPFARLHHDTNSAEFVGRADVVALVESVLDWTKTGDSKSIVFHGPAGIGKSTTLSYIARRAKQLGAAVYHGRSVEGPAPPPYEPWLRIIRRALEREGPAELVRALGLHAGDVARAFPEIARSLGLHPSEAMGFDRGSRLRVNDAIGNWVRSRAERSPLVLIFDDLHLADIDSIQLLRHLLQELDDEPVRLIGAYRDRAQRDENHDALDRLSALQPSSSLRLKEFDRQGVEEFARSRSSDEWSNDDLERLADATGGNPLFLDQMIARGRREWPPPREGLRDAGERGLLLRLLDDASPRGAQLLEYACVLGREFDPTVVSTGFGVPLVDVQDLVEELVQLRILERVEEPGRVRFIHGLIPEALYSGLGAHNRADHHRRAFTAYLSTRRRPHERLSEIAHHAHQALDLIGFEHAFEHVLEDARDAARRLAFDDAIQRYGRAREMPGADARSITLCLIEQATAMVMSGRAEEARPLFAQACSNARELDDPILFAKAALGPEHVEEYVEPAGERTALLSEGIERLAGRDDALKIRLLQALSRTSYYHDERCALDASRVALETARALGDRSLICSSALARSEALGWTSHREERRALVREANEVAAHYDVKDADRGAALRFAAHEALTAGDGAAYRYQLQRVEAFARDRKIAFFDWTAAVMRGTLAVIEGRFRDAKLDIDRQIELGSQSNPVLSLQLATVHRSVMQIIDDEPAVLLRSMEALVNAFPEISPWRAVMALAFAQTGAPECARETLQPLVESDFAPRHSDLLPVCLAVTAQVAHKLDDRPLAAAVLQRLCTVLDRFVVVGIGMAGYGSTERFRGLCSETLGQMDDAIECYEHGIEIDRAMAAWPFIAQGLDDLARALRSRRRPGDERTARQAAVEARRIANDLGLVGMLERFQSRIT